MQRRNSSIHAVLLLTRSTSISPGSGSVLAALDPAHAHDKPAHLDISIARHAAALAEALQLELHAVPCLPNTVYPLGEVSSAQRQRMRRRVHSQLKRVMKRSGVTARGLHVLDANVGDGVPALAHKLPAQIIAMGIISRRWLERFVIGDTAESVIRDVPCDLLLIKPDNFRIRLGRSRKQASVLPKAR
jgi:universal stress protein E